jgi:predicted enzyme related to lactoylglutathione lyase
MITAIAFTVYPVSSMERARAFYEHVLGLHVGYQYKSAWVEYDIGGSTFAISTTEMGRVPGAKGAVVAFEVSDFDAFMHKLKDRAVVFVAEPFDTPVCRMAVIEDEDGNHLTIHKRHPDS